MDTQLAQSEEPDDKLGRMISVDCGSVPDHSKMRVLGLTVPLGGGELSLLPGMLREIGSRQFTDLWSSEVSGTDAFTPLAVAAITNPEQRLGTAIVSAYTRSPALLAMSAASLAGLARTEVVLGLGSSSDVIVEKWNGLVFDKPFHRVRDTVRFLKRALTGERVDYEGDTFQIHGFRIAAATSRKPKIAVAALRQGMLALAGREADGAIINWLSPEDVRKVVPHVLEQQPDAEIIARLFVAVGRDADAARLIAKRHITTYLNVPVYAEFHRWLGRAAMLEPMWQAWNSGDRQRALAQVPDDLVDQLFLIGTPSEIVSGIDAYVKSGVTTPVLSILGDENLALSASMEIGSKFQEPRQARDLAKNK